MLLLSAMWFWAERFLGGGQWVPLQKELQTSVNIQVRSPPPALLSPPPSNLAPGGFVLQNLIDASDPSLTKCLSAAARKMSPKNPDLPLLSTSLSVILFLPREMRFVVSWFTPGVYSRSGRSIYPYAYVFSYPTFSQ